MHSVRCCYLTCNREWNVVKYFSKMPLYKIPHDLRAKSDMAKLRAVRGTITTLH